MHVISRFTAFQDEEMTQAGFFHEDTRSLGKGQPIYGSQNGRALLSQTPLVGAPSLGDCR